MHLVSVPYTFDLSVRQVDTENMIMLTNNHIREFELCAEDDDYYRKWLQLVANKDQVRKQRAAEATRRWRRKLARQQSISNEPLDMNPENNDIVESFWNPREE